MLQDIVFWVLAALALAGAVGMLANRNPVYSVLSLIVTFFAMGGLYLSLEAEFLAVIQIIVYAGAIMVLFLFVIMLLNQDRIEPEHPRFDWRRGAAFILGLGFLVMVAYALLGVQHFPASEGPFRWGKTEPLGALLFTFWLLPFEMISVILLAALMGALIVARQPTRNDL